MTTLDPAATTVVTEADLRAHLERLLGALGVPGDQAALVADNLVEADLRGVDSHGSHLMALYDGRVRSGHIKPVTAVTTLDDHGSTVRLDGGMGFGQIAGVAAIDLAIERARPHGVATVSVRELTHLGALAYYTMRASAAGCFAMAFQNGAMIVPPFGGTTSLFSTNPFSYAVPAGRHPDVVYDIATTAAAGNKILLARKRGDATIPEGWANDEHGYPTTDPNAASISQLQWFGGHKGFGIGLLVEIMAGVLADSSFGATEHSESELTGWDRVTKARASWCSTSRGSCRSTTSARTSTSSSTTCTHRRSPRAPSGFSSPVSSRPSAAHRAHSARHPAVRRARRRARRHGRLPRLPAIPR